MKLDQRKVGGPDNITAMFLKKMTENIPSFTDCIHYLISKSIKFGEVPRVWRHANVAPVYKGGDRSDVNNYRPISLT